MTTRDFTFESGGHTLSGIISEPTDGPAKALVIFVHGYGHTDVRGWQMYAELRDRFATLGIASATWDKPGQGRSGGTFDINQPVESSAREVLDAIGRLRGQHVPGVGRLVIWGISRAGWIAPIVLSSDHSIRFWISVSGTTAEDNYLYLLRSNLPCSSDAEADVIVQEWKQGFGILSSGGSFDDYCAATPHLRANAYVNRMTHGPYTRETYQAAQAQFQKDRDQVDPSTGMQLYINDFDSMLSRLDVDVLALFGEKDRNVDWCKTRAFYSRTIGGNPHASLTIKTFPQGNHNIDVCTTGSLREMETMTHWRKCDGYYKVQVDWLKAHVLQ